MRYIDWEAELEKLKKAKPSDEHDAELHRQMRDGFCQALASQSDALQSIEKTPKGWMAVNRAAHPLTFAWTFGAALGLNWIEENAK